MSGLTAEHLRWLGKILEDGPEKGGSRQYIVPDDVHDLLVEKAYIRWDRGVLVITEAGVRALERH